MKNLIVAVSFTLVSLMLPLTMAQLAVAQDAPDNQEAVESQSRIAAEETNVVVDGKKRSIVVDFDADDDEIKDDEIKKVVDKVTGVLGESFGRELTVEINSLSDREKRQLSNELEDLFDGNGIRIGGHGGIGLGESLIALVAICLTLGLPVIILLLVLVFGQKKRKQMMDLAGAYLAADKPMPEHVMGELGSGMSSNKRLRSGLQLTLVGLALGIFLSVVAEPELFTIGLLPMAIGIARLIYWKYESKQPNVNEVNDEEINLS